MVYDGHVQNGVVVVDDPIKLPDGMKVKVEFIAPSSELQPAAPGPTLYDQLAPLVGAAKGLPPDLASNHDVYLHGQFKQ